MKLRDILTESGPSFSSLAKKLPKNSNAEEIHGIKPTEITDDNAKQRRIRRLLKNNPKMADAVKIVSKEPDHEFIGSGLSAYVHRSNNPHNLDRVSRTSRKSDGGQIYLEFIYQHPELHDNPFFPKIRNRKELSSGHVTFEVEPLVPFETDHILSNEEQMAALAHQYFTQEFVEDVTDGDPVSVVTFVVGVENALQDPMNVAHIKDPQLLKAIFIIQDIQQQYDYNLKVDLHEENVMWRITRMGPQLVITDPLWGGWMGLGSQQTARIGQS